MIFSFTPVNGKIVWDSPFQVSEWCLDNDKKHHSADLQPSVITSQKMKMYSYYHKCLIPIAIKELNRLGWQSVDAVFADHFFKSEFARDIKFNPILDKQQIYLEDKAKMTKERLTKFLNDCINMIEIDWGIPAPNSSEYKYKLTGFKSVKTFNNGK